MKEFKHTKNEFKKKIKGQSFNDLQKEIQDINLELQKGRILKYKGINPYGTNQDKGFDMRMLRYKKSVINQELLMRSRK